MYSIVPRARINIFEEVYVMQMLIEGTTLKNR